MGRGRPQRGRHARRGSQVYVSWSGMMRRCYNRNSKDYHYYGGRGIQVCDRWHDFDVFMDDMWASHRPGLSIDRIDNNGHYSPSNCRWSDQKTQCRNRSSNALITNPNTGEQKTIQEWCDYFGLPRSRISNRIHILKLKEFGLIFSMQQLPRGTRHDHNKKLED